MNAYLSDKTLKILADRTAREQLRTAIRQRNGDATVQLGDKSYQLVRRAGQAKTGHQG